jgi:Rieske 2Fe-2S family protein
MAALDFDVDNVAGFWDVINRQDWHVCELSQKGMQSPAYTPGPYYEWQEIGLIGIDREVLQALGHERNGRYHHDIEDVF